MNMNIISYGRYGDFDIISGWMLGRVGDIKFSDYLIEHYKDPEFSPVNKDVFNLYLNRDLKGGHHYESEPSEKDESYSKFFLRLKETDGKGYNLLLTIGLGINNSWDFLLDNFPNMWKEFEMEEGYINRKDERECNRACIDLAGSFIEEFINYTDKIKSAKV